MFGPAFLIPVIIVFYSSSFFNGGIMPVLAAPQWERFSSLLSSPEQQQQQQRSNWNRGYVLPQSDAAIGHRRSGPLITMGRLAGLDGDDRDMLERQEEQRGSGNEWTNSRGGTAGRMAPIERPARNNNNNNVPSSMMMMMPFNDQQFPPTVSASAPINNVAAASAVSAIDRFDTSLDRFATGPAAGVPPNRVILPMDVLQRLSSSNSNNARIWKYAEEQQQQQSTIGQKTDLPPPNSGQQQQQSGLLPPSRTRYLTNQAIVGTEQQQQQLATAQNGTRGKIWKGTEGHRESNPAANSMDLNEIVRPPILPDFRHEDIRPAIDGERLGAQGKFSGQTNEYREDWGHEFTRTGNNIMSQDGRRIPLAEFGPKRMEMGDGPASKLMNLGFNPSPQGARVIIGDETENKQSKVQNTGTVERDRAKTDWHDQIRPYVNAPEEITGSRWRNIDEKFNIMNGGNRGRGPNRYVKIDLLNE